MIGKTKRYVPCLHVCLAVLLRLGVVEFERTEASARHNEEGNILNIFYILLVDVLHKKSVYYSVAGHSMTNVEDLENIRIADNCKTSHEVDVHKVHKGTHTIKGNSFRATFFQRRRDFTKNCSPALARLVP